MTHSISTQAPFGTGIKFVVLREWLGKVLIKKIPLHLSTNRYIKKRNYKSDESYVKKCHN